VCGLFFAVLYLPFSSSLSLSLSVCLWRSDGRPKNQRSPTVTGEEEKRQVQTSKRLYDDTRFPSCCPPFCLSTYYLSVRFLSLASRFCFTPPPCHPKEVKQIRKGRTRDDLVDRSGFKTDKTLIGRHALHLCLLRVYRRAPFLFYFSLPFFFCFFLFLASHFLVYNLEMEEDG